VKLTFLEATEKITRLAAALQAVGIKKGDRIGQFSENSWSLPALITRRWAAHSAHALSPASLDLH
jgi:long-subunit acyl-CoA synthetase (AMP-forming)